MRGLLSVELRRILARRTTRLFGALVLLGAILAGTVLFLRSGHPDPNGADAARQQAIAARDREVVACTRGDYGIRADQIPPGLTLAEFCDRFAVGPPVAHDPEFHLTNVRTVFNGTNVILMVLLMSLGASLVGAEWHAGTITTLLTWEPRRVRVLTAKLSAAAAFAFVALLAAQALIATALLPSALLHGTSAGADWAWLRSVAGFELRAATIAALATGLAFGVASIARNTAFAVGGLFAYLAVLEPIVRAARPRWQPWFLYDNVATFLTGHSVDFTLYGRSATGAGLVIAGYTAGVALVAVAVFRRRDVT